MALAQYSLPNLANSVASYLGDILLANGYLLIHKSTDMLRTPDGYYPNYFAAQSAILSDPTVAGRVQASRGFLCLLDQDTAIPEYPVRPTSDGFLISKEDVPVPALWITVDHFPNGSLREIGSKRRFRYCDLAVLGYAKDYQEQLFLADLLRTAFDETLYIPLHDYAAGTLSLVGTLEVQSPDVNVSTFPLNIESKVHEVALTATLCYEA